MAPQLSDLELTQRILDMAKTGVYRASILEALQPVATQRQIRNAITQAKQFGLRSDRTLRDAELGTYYQVDLRRYQSFQAAIAAAVPLESTDIASQILLTTQALRRMLVVAGGSAIALFMVGGVCLVTGHLASGRLAWLIALSIGGIWVVQKALARSLV
ncbi:MAG: hypothetical protein HC812_17930 [Leptolyngbya sp. RL_3_1]|nr:hypothetical protein [Leptolyngbya sp. RL_3_1]